MRIHNNILMRFLEHHLHDPQTNCQSYARLKLSDVHNQVSRLDIYLFSRIHRA